MKNAKGKKMQPGLDDILHFTFYIYWVFEIY